jgi:hypothetical protein
MSLSLSRGLVTAGKVNFVLHYLNVTIGLHEAQEKFIKFLKNGLPYKRLYLVQNIESNLNL